MEEHPQDNTFMTDVGHDCRHWFGTIPTDCDVPHWLPYLDDDVLGLTGKGLVISISSEADRNEEVA